MRMRGRASEITVTSIDREGTRQGFDVELTRAVASSVNVPVIASCGYGEPRHIEAVVAAGADAVAVADALHYNRTTLAELRSAAQASGISMRNV